MSSVWAALGLGLTTWFWCWYLVREWELAKGRRKPDWLDTCLF